MAKDADLIIGLQWRGWAEDAAGGPDSQRGLFNVNVGYNDPDDAADAHEFGEGPLEVNLADLSTHAGAWKPYGEELSAQFFKSAKIDEFYRKAKTSAERGDLQLHIRLRLDAA